MAARSKATITGVTPGRQHPGLNLRADGLRLCCIGRAHSRCPLLGHLLAQFDSGLPLCVDLAGVVQNKALHEQERRR